MEITMLPDEKMHFLGKKFCGFKKQSYICSPK